MKSLSRAWAEWEHKGVVYNIPIELEDDPNLEDAMRQAGVQEFKCIPAKMGRKMTILAFPTATIPRSLLLFEWSYPIKQYIPRPLQCKKCWRLNHSQQRCRQEPACPICHLRHEGMGHECSNPKFCINCKAAEHVSDDRSCPQYLKKQEIIKVAITRKISFVEAAAFISQNTMQNENPWRKDDNHPSGGTEIIPTLEAKIRELTKRVEVLEQKEHKTDEALRIIEAKMVTPQTLEDKLKKVEDRMIDKLDMILTKLSQGPSTKRPSASRNGPEKRRPNLTNTATKQSSTNLDSTDKDLGHLGTLPNDWIDPNAAIDNE